MNLTNEVCGADLFVPIPTKWLASGLLPMLIMIHYCSVARNLDVVLKFLAAHVNSI